MALVAAAFWGLTKFVITIAHEGGHAVMGSAAGGQVAHLRVFSNGNGVCELLGLGRFGAMLMLLNGHIAPSLFGLLGCVMLIEGSAVTVLWVSLFLLLLALLQVDKVFSAFAVLATAAVIFAVLRYAPAGGQTLFAYTWIWFLLIGGFVHVVQFNAVRRAARAVGREPDNDAKSLRDLTWLPGGFWIGFWWLATLGALLFGAAILLGLVGRR
jgi:hypothetical protein